EGFAGCICEPEKAVGSLSHAKRTPAPAGVRFAFPMSRLSPFPLARSSWCAVILTSLGILISQQTRAASNWPSTLTRDPRGSFPDLRSVRATYVYGWSGITAAASDVYFHRGDQETFV
ncbi:MAG: hypothetical protein DMF19_13690, partial [Verrucomicrobia bacterium]